MKVFKIILICVVIMVLIAGCANESEPEVINGDETRPYAVEGELPSSPLANELIQESVTNLAERLEVSQEEITYLAFDLVVWPDSSYGCPLPDEAYQQVEKEGYKVELRANGRLYTYHGGEERNPFLCEPES